jgi:hypothetical protein
MTPKEAAIQSAIADLESGVFTSQRQAANAYNISPSTLRGRLAGQQPHATAHQHQQRLTPKQENFVAEWILDKDSRAQPPTHARVREMATRVLRINNDTTPLGNEWISQFLSQQPRVASIVGQSIVTTQAQAASPNVIQAFLKLFKRTRIELGIQYKDI